ncbi:MAG: hypothetical protein LIP23_04965, partial [Planctomycetes bacterium]|nr:hypothetical protein [Planctomycetota bacterium]
MKQEQRIVCITNKHLGNCVCYLPEMRHLSRFHNAQVDFVTKKVPPVQLFRDVDFISDVILLKRWQWVFWFNPIAHRLARRVRSGMYKRVYLIIPDRKQANRFKRLFQLWGVAPELVVNVKPYGSEAEHALPEFAYGPHDLAPPDLTARQDEIARLQKRLRDASDWNG